MNNPNPPERKLKNKLSDLNTHLFEQLERLNDEDLKGDALEEEIKRAKTVTNVAAQIVNNGNLMLSAQKALGDELFKKEGVPRMLTD